MDFLNRILLAGPIFIVVRRIARPLESSCSHSPDSDHALTIQLQMLNSTTMAVLEISMCMQDLLFQVSCLSSRSWRAVRRRALHENAKRRYATETQPVGCILDQRNSGCRKFTRVTSC